MRFIRTTLISMRWLGVWALIMALTLSCSNPEKDFEKAREKNMISAFEDYMSKHPDHRTDEAQAMIVEIAFKNAIKQRTKRALHRFVEKYQPDTSYLSQIDEIIAQKKEYLQAAIEKHKQAQQETSKETQRKLFDESEELFRKAHFSESMLEIVESPLLNLHLGQGDALKKEIEKSFQVSRYLYGGSAMSKYEYSVANELLHTYTIYDLMLASKGKTSLAMKVLLKRGNKNLEICHNNILVSSNRFSSFTGFIKNKHFDLQQGDKIVLEITATGDDFGMTCQNFKSYIKLLKSEESFSDETLSQRARAVSWITSSLKNKYPSSLLLSVVAQLDLCMLEKIRGTWLVGDGLTNSSVSYIAKWLNPGFFFNILSDEEVAENSLKEFEVSFSRE